MTIEAILLAVTTSVAAVAVVVAVIALRAVRRLSGRVAEANPAPVDAPAAVVHEPALPAPRRPIADTSELAPRLVQGRVVVPPTQAQVVRAALGRPGVRLSIVMHGLAHALRPENRDRIVALMRREYRHRRSQRLSIGRQAVRAARPTSALTSDQRPDLRLAPDAGADRMIAS